MAVNGPGGPVELRTIDRTTPTIGPYLPPGSGFLIPVAPLQPGTAYDEYQVDVTGARALRAKIEERQLRHWQQARAVREGLQDPADPDAESLVRCLDGVREYEPRPGHRFLKLLVDGRWDIGAAEPIA